MLWFTVWSVLVVGTLVGAFFLGRSLYRAARDLLAELERVGHPLELGQQVASGPVQAAPEEEGTHQRADHQDRPDGEPEHPPRVVPDRRYPSMEEGSDRR